MIEKIKIGNRNIVIRVKKMIVLGIQQFQDPYYQGVAAQLAFFMFLSILPTFILLSQVLGFFSLSLSSIENWVDINISGAGPIRCEGCSITILRNQQCVPGIHSGMGSLQSAVCDDTGYQLYADGRRHDGRGVCQGPNPFHQNHFDNSVYGCLCTRGAGIRTAASQTHIPQSFGK